MEENDLERKSEGEDVCHLRYLCPWHMFNLDCAIVSLASQSVVYEKCRQLAANVALCIEGPRNCW